MTEVQIMELEDESTDEIRVNRGEYGVHVDINQWRRGNLPSSCLDLTEQEAHELSARLVGEYVDAEIVEDDEPQNIVSSADPFELSDEDKDRMLRERALDMAVRAGEGDKVTMAGKYYAFMKGEGK